MKIAYITTDSPYDKNSWSGTNYYLRKALEDQNHHIYCIYGYKKLSLSILIKKIWAKITNKHFQAIRTMASSKGWARYIETRLLPNTDAIVCLSTIPVAFLKTDIPIYIYVDGIYEYMLQQGFKNILNSHKIAHHIEQLALNNCTKIITSSENSAKAILQYYDINQSKIEIVPLGANFDKLPSSEFIQKNIEQKEMDKCRILFIGVDWERKGANIVVDTAQILHNSGFPIEVHLVGLKELPIKIPSYIINHGFISKMGNDGIEKLNQLYLSSHFLFVPSIAEAYGIVFVEASAYGVPVISHAVGGIPSIVKNEINGHLFKLGTTPDVFACYIKQLFNNKVAYKALAHKSHTRFLENLSWSSSGEKMRKIIRLSMNQTKK